MRHASLVQGIVEVGQVLVDERVQGGHGLVQFLRRIGDLLILGFGRSGGVAIEFRHQPANALRNWRRRVMERAACTAEAAFRDEFAVEIVDFFLEGFRLLHDLRRNLGASGFFHDVMESSRDFFRPAISF